MDNHPVNRNLRGDLSMSNLENTNIAAMTVQEDKTPSGDIKYIKIDNTTYEVVSNYVGKNSLLDIIKSAIKRDVESGNY